MSKTVIDGIDDDDEKAWQTLDMFLSRLVMQILLIDCTISANTIYTMGAKTSDFRNTFLFCGVISLFVFVKLVVLLC